MRNAKYFGFTFLQSDENLNFQAEQYLESL
jgi:hypothetical protein